MSFSSDSCLLLVLVRYIAAKDPDNAATMPAIVGSVAFETPPAIALASPPPLNAITWNTSIIPVTVPKSPNKGASTIQV